MLHSARGFMERDATPVYDGRVLAIDDNVLYLETLALALGEEGFDVRTVSSGAEALAWLELNVADAVLLDLAMPNGLSGSETCKRLKAHPELRGIPVLILTGHADPATLIEVIDAGADDCIAKDVDLGILAARLRAQLRRRKLLANTHHKIARPAQAIMEVARLLLRTNLTEEQRAYVGQIRSSAEEIWALEELRRLERRLPGQATPPPKSGQTGPAAG